MFGAPDPDPNRPDAPNDPADVNYPNYAVAVVHRTLANQAGLLALISSWLRVSLSNTAVVSTVAGTLGLADAMTNRLLVDWIQDGTVSALTTLLELAGGGLTGHYFSGVGFTGTETVVPSEAVAAQVTGDSAYRSARWIGHVLPLGDGDHRFVVRSNGAVTITIAGVSRTIAPASSVVDTELRYP